MLVLAMQFSRSCCVGCETVAEGHDEVLYTLRRRARKKKQAKAPTRGARSRSFKTE